MYCVRNQTKTGVKKKPCTCDIAFCQQNDLSTLCADRSRIMQFNWSNQWLKPDTDPDLPLNYMKADLGLSSQDYSAGEQNIDLYLPVKSAMTDLGLFSVLRLIYLSNK